MTRSISVIIYLLIFHFEVLGQQPFNEQHLTIKSNQ